MMGNLIAFFGMTVGGWIGWALGAHFGMIVAFLISLIGSAVGLYATRRWMRDFLG